MQHDDVRFATWPVVPGLCSLVDVILGPWSETIKETLL